MNMLELEGYPGVYMSLETALIVKAWISKRIAWHNDRGGNPSFRLLEDLDKLESLVLTLKVIECVVDKEIVALDLSEDRLLLTFSNGKIIKLFDNSQRCCERRYMHSDDVLQYFVGSRLIGIEVCGAPNIKSKKNVHEVQFLIVTTSMGAFTVETHNVHNGYYDGFLVRAVIEENKIENKEEV